MRRVSGGPRARPAAGGGGERERARHRRPAHGPRSAIACSSPGARTASSPPRCQSRPSTPDAWPAAARFHANWPELPDEAAARSAPGRSAAVAAGHGDGRTRLAQLCARAAGARPGLPAPLLSVRRVVHARRPRRRWRCRSTWRIRGSSGSRRRRCSRSKAASTSGACASCATRPATSSTTPTSCACGGSAARCSAARRSRIRSSTRRKPVQQELRAAPRSVVRAEPSRRGLRRDVRGVADAGVELEDALRRAGRR